MKCLFCGELIDDNVRFCGKCGKQIPRCPKCGEVISKKSIRFCLNDGTPIPEEILNMIPEQKEEHIIVKNPEILSSDDVAYDENEVEKAIGVYVRQEMENDLDQMLQREIDEKPKESEQIPNKQIQPMRYCLNCGSLCNNGETLCDNCKGKAIAEKNERKEIRPKTRQKYCIKCGGPCGNNDTLCENCRKKSGKKSKVIPILLVVIILLLAAVGSAAAYIGIREKMFSDNKEVSFIEEKTGEVIDRTADEKVEESEKLDEETESSEEEISKSSESGNLKETEESNEKETEKLNEKETEKEAKESEVDNLTKGSEETDDPVMYFIMNCDSVKFTEKDIEGFDESMCRYARNGIYARLGRKFDDDALTEYFSQYDWYKPTIDPDDFSESYLNSYQLANRDLIVAYEKENGY